jgi:hypothetical protein
MRFLRFGLIEKQICTAESFGYDILEIKDEYSFHVQECDTTMLKEEIQSAPK